MLREEDVGAVLKKHFPKLEENEETFEGDVIYVINGWIEFLCNYYQGWTQTITLMLYAQKEMHEYESHEDIIADLKQLDAIADEITSFSEYVARKKSYTILPRWDYDPECKDSYPTTECISCRNLDLGEISLEGLNSLSDMVAKKYLA